MFNLHLLQIELTVEEYRQVTERMFLHPRPPNPASPSFDYIRALPTYVIARCPLCWAKNLEKVDTYSMETWPGVTTMGDAVCTNYYAQHCEHFALAQTFFHFHGIQPVEVGEKEFGPEVPYVIGHLLEDGWCLAVLHALPVCRIEGNAFVPRYTLFMISYFSSKPKTAYERLLAHNRPYGEPFVNKAFLPQVVREHWWDLRQWVSVGQLYWVDGNDPELEIHTHDVEAFPYGDIKGRTHFDHPGFIPRSRKSKPRRKGGSG